ncbi:MAG: phosphate/phosphite/phosphonate ABC transporter substrate-binding protein [Rhodoferax sp.]|nr:phosphate/phosphite/phosphonate ABC transporter substrate-binding protein [Rhodoferax sp.]
MAARHAAAGLLCLLMFGGSARATAKCESPDELRFSVIPAGDVEKRIMLYQPLFDRLQALTGRRLRVVRSSSYAAVAEGLISGRIDIASIGPAGYIEAKNGDPQVTAFATFEKRAGVYQTQGPFYHSHLIVLAAGRYGSFGELRNARLSLPDPGSTSGSLLPRDELAPRLGMAFESFFGAVSYAGSHVKSIDALLRGDVDAAFVASTQLEEALRSGKFAARPIKSLWHSAPIPYDPMVWRGQLCEPIKKQIRAAYFDDPAALRSLLDGIESSGFVPIDDRHYAGIRKIVERAP